MFLMKISRDDQKMLHNVSMAVGQRNTPLSILGAERVCTLRLIQPQLPQTKQTNTLCQRELGLCSFPAKKHGSVTLKTSTKHQPQPTTAIKKSYQNNE